MIHPLNGEKFARQEKYRRRKRRRNRHHLTPRSRGGRDVYSNLLLIDEEKHALIHKIFGNRTWTEIIDVMQRLARMKGYTP